MANNRIILDSGAITALANEEEAIRVATRKALTAGATLVIPTVVVAESTTIGGPRDAPVNRVLKLGLIADCDLETARTAASLRFRTRQKAGAIDAIVIATADRVPGSTVLTSDVGDLGPLAGVRKISSIIDIS